MGFFGPSQTKINELFHDCCSGHADAQASVRSRIASYGEKVIPMITGYLDPSDERRFVNACLILGEITAKHGGEESVAKALGQFKDDTRLNDNQRLALMAAYQECRKVQKAKCDVMAEVMRRYGRR